MSPTFIALRNRNYRLFMAGGVLSNIGTWMQRIAQDWMVLRLSDYSGTAVGITTALQFLPLLLISPYAGVVADRFNKRRLLQLAQIAMAIPAIVLAVLAITGVATQWHVFVLAFLFGVGSAFEVPARQSFVSEMVQPDELTNAVGLNAVSFNSARLIGPALAGVLIAALGSGVAAAGWVVLLNALSNGAVILALQRMDPRLLRTPKPVARERGQIVEGMRYLRSRPDILLVMVVVFFAGTFGFNFQITSALMATHVFHKGAGEFGLLGSTLAIGSLAGALLAARRQRIPIKLVVSAAVGFGIALTVGGLMPTYLAFAVFSPLIGLCSLTMMTSANANVQLATETQFRGRVMALYMMVFQGGTPLGAPLIGWIGEHVGARWTLIIGGLLTLAGALLAVAVFGKKAKVAVEDRPVDRAVLTTR